MKRKSVRRRPKRAESPPRSVSVAAAAVESTPSPAQDPPIGARSSQHALARFAPWFAALLVAIAVARIAFTWPIFSQTWDEPGHIACGLQYLLEGRYTYERQHPPGARMATAFGPWLAGANFGAKPAPARDEAGLDALYGGHGYKRNLMLARAGMVPFFVLGVVVVWFWTRRLAGPTAALTGVFLFTTTPPVLAHAGVATTDMPSAATIALVFFVLSRWWSGPSWPLSALLGAALALTVYMKYSALAYVPAGFGALVAAGGLRRAISGSLFAGIRRSWTPFVRLVFAGIVFVGLLWAGFRFSWDHIVMRHMVRPEIAGLRFPMPELVDGILQVLDHNRGGHPAWLLGEYSEKGWRSFFLIALAVKSPIPLLLLTCVALWALIRRVRSGQAELSVLHPAFFALAVLAVAVSGRINIGVRHILPMYLLLAVTAGAGTVWLLRKAAPKLRVAVLILLAWQLINSVTAHPDYLGWFNETVRSAPEYVLVDSDLDWGQDLDRLAARVRERGIQELSLSYFGCARPQKHGFPRLRLLAPAEPAAGWVAMSVSNKTKQSYAWRDLNKGKPAFEWIERFSPIERVGKSILLYYIPPE